MTYILIAIAIFLLFVFVSVLTVLRMQLDKNKELQKENSDLIDRNICLQEELRRSQKYNSTLNSKIDNLNGILKKKKDLLEIQDKLLDENNIKH